MDFEFNANILKPRRTMNPNQKLIDSALKAQESMKMLLDLAVSSIKQAVDAQATDEQKKEFYKHINDVDLMGKISDLTDKIKAFNKNK